LALNIYELEIEDNRPGDAVNVLDWAMPILKSRYSLLPSHDRAAVARARMRMSRSLLHFKSGQAMYDMNDFKKSLKTFGKARELLSNPKSWAAVLDEPPQQTCPCPFLFTSPNQTPVKAMDLAAQLFAKTIMFEASANRRLVSSLSSVRFALGLLLYSLLLCCWCFV